MTAGSVDGLPARDHRDLHSALAGLDGREDEVTDQLWNRFGGRRPSAPDAAVGRRTDGVTPAVWEAVGQGLMAVATDGQEAVYLVTDAGTAHSRRLMMGMTPAEIDYLREVGAEWAFASTSRKKAASARSSSSGARVARLA